MKRILSLFTAFFCLLTLSAADLTGVKIYINPGHGGYDSNDRSVATIPFPTAWENPTGFWESASNLTKGLYLRDLLQAKNATVLMSRTENTTADDRTLSVIAAEASSNNVDAFLSIHSNAAGATTAVNYLYLMCPGKGGENDQVFRDPQTEALAKACWPFLWNNPLNVWTHYTETSTKIACFVTSYGVIGASLTAPGFLSEGSFHDYKPETHRLLSEDYRKLEATRFFHFYSKFFNADMPTTGILTGDVRDAHTRMTNALYLPYISGSKDQWQPINGTVVTLCNSAGTPLKTYTVDNNFNGIFVFWDLTPGSYKLKYTATDYVAQEIDVTVQAGKITNQNILLTSVNYDPNANRVAPDDYPKPVQDAGAQLPTSFTANQSSTNATDWLSSKAIRRSIIKGSKMYLLTNDSRIIVANSTSGDSITQLSTQGIAGGTRLISDIAFTSDTVLLACNSEILPFSASDKYWKVYKWASDTAEPTLLFSTQTQGNFTEAEVGSTFAVSGASWNCKVYTTSTTTSASRQIRILGFEHKENEGVIAKKYMLDASYTETAWGSSMKFAISPRGADRLMIDSDLMPLTEYGFDWTIADRSPLINHGTLPVEKVAAASFGANYFKYAGKQLMITPTANSLSADVGIALYDITNGLSAASLLWQQSPSTFTTPLPLPHMTAAAVVSGYDISMTLFTQNKGVEKYNTVTTDVVANIYASELKMDKINDQYRFTFTLNEDATNIEIQFTRNNVVVGSIQAGGFIKGTHSVDVSPSELPSIDESGIIDLNWQIKATAQSAIRINKLSNDSERFQFYSPFGVAVDNNSESPYFGRVYVTNGKAGACTGGRTTAQGLYILGTNLTDITQQGNSAYGGNITWGLNYSPYRVNIAPDGRIFICDYSNEHSGIWIADPAAPNSSFSELFSGCTRTATGLSTYNGTNVFGSLSSCFIQGTGESTTLYTTDEDYLSSGSGPNVLKYNIGTKTTWTEAPSGVVFERNTHKLLINKNNKIMPDGRGGWWITQYRAAETATEPCLVHFTGTEVDFHTGKDLLIKNSRNGALAVSLDGKRVATSGPSLIDVWDVTYDENGRVASFQKAFTITSTIGGLGTSSNDLAFDPAGNLYYVSNSTERLVVISLPKGDNSFVSKAPSAQTIQIEGTSTDTPEPTKQLRAYANGGTLVVEAEINERIQVYSLTGSCLIDVVATETINRFSLESHQVVIVKAGDRTTKVVM